MKVWKCGNNQIRLLEKQLYRSGSVRGKYSDNGLDHIMARLKSIQRQNQNVLPPTCIYTAIRDPISHFLSGYNEMEYRQLSKDAKPTERLPKIFEKHLSIGSFPIQVTITNSGKGDFRLSLRMYCSKSQCLFPTLSIGTSIR